jgi:neutral ceramidase
MTMVNGGAKYMADAESYDKITYAAMNSRCA